MPLWHEINKSDQKDRDRFYWTTIHLRHLLDSIQRCQRLNKLGPYLLEYKESHEYYFKRLWDLQLRFCWAGFYLAQIWRQWTGWYQINTPPYGFPMDTFILIKNNIVFSLFHKINTTTTLFIQEAVNGPKQSNKSLEDKVIIDSWKYISELEDTLHSVEKSLMELSREFEGRTATGQILSMEDPSLLIGEQSGFQDLWMDAANRLFRSYAGRSRNNSALYTAERDWRLLLTAFNESLESFYGNDRYADKTDDEYKNIMNYFYKPGSNTSTHIGVDFTWHGVVSSSSGNDYQVDDKLRILFLPVRSKIGIENELPILAHEASHYLLSALELHDPSYIDGVKSSIWKPLFKAFFEELSYCSENLPVSKDILSIIKSLSEDIPDVILHDFINSSNEILCDMIACLISGPSYIRSLQQLYVNPFIESSNDYTGDSRETHPKTWVRLLLCQTMIRNLGWIPEKECPDNSQSSDPWEAGRELDSFLNMYYGNYINSGKDGNIITASIRFAKILQNLNLQNYVTIFGFKYSLQLTEIASILVNAINNHPESLLPLIQWADKNGERFLFYPSFIEINSEGKYCLNIDKQRILVRGVNHYCLYLAERIIHDSNIILDAPLKYVASLSTLPIIKRPLYPTGHMLLSLFYSEDDWKPFELMLEGLLPSGWTRQEI